MAGGRGRAREGFAKLIETARAELARVHRTVPDERAEAETALATTRAEIQNLVERHRIVMENDNLLGIVSISDLVRSIVADQDLTIDPFEQYIHRR